MARVAVSRPGRSPARVNSFARCAETLLLAGFSVVCAPANAPNRKKMKDDHLRRRPLARAARPSLLRQDGIQSRLKVLLALARQFAAFDRQGSFHCLHPGKQFLDVLARFLVILLQVARSGHPVSECSLDRMVRALKRVCGRTGCEQSRMPGEEMFEAQIPTKWPVAAAMPSS